MYEALGRELLAANSSVRASIRKSRPSSRECLFTLTRANLTREPVYVTDKLVYFVNISIFLLTFRLR